MRRLFVLLSLMLTAGVLTPAAVAGPAAMTAIDLRPSSGVVAVPLEPGHRFTLAGLHWRGSGDVVFRTHSLDGRWSSWRPVAPEDEDGPNLGSHEERTEAGWRIGNPWWVGPSDRLEIRTAGRVDRVRAHLIWSPAIDVPLRVPAATEAPPIVSRLAWRADESIRRAPPSYAPSIRFAVVHHTAGGNNYSRAEAAAIVKGIQLYHVQGNGWNDIGYNFVVDRFGTIYEGRYGGIERNVIGAHARGFNTGSVGIALLGTYGDTTPSRAAQDALAKLIAWRLDLAHVDPLEVLTALSGGSERFAPNVSVKLRAVSGHRDTGLTECPGDNLYARLNALAETAPKLGGPKIYDPRIEANAEGLVRFRARTSTPLSWSVVVTSGGAPVARGTGSGSAIDWTWDAAPVPPATYAWSISAGAARPAAGTIRAGLNATELAIAEASATPEGITPNGDGQADSAVLTFTLTTAANVSVEVMDVEGFPAATVLDRVWTSAGEHSLAVDGSPLPDGSYSVIITARTATSSEVVQAVPLTVSRTLGLVSIAPVVFSPNADGRLDRVAISFSLGAEATVTVRILREEHWVATPLVAVSLAPGAQRVVWDGSRSDGRLRDGSLSAVVEVADAVGTVSFGVPFASDTVAPRVRMLAGPGVRIDVSEAAVLKVWVNGEPVRREVKRARTVLISWREPVRRARVVAWDAAGNASPAAVWRPSA